MIQLPPSRPVEVRAPGRVEVAKAAAAVGNQGTQESWPSRNPELTLILAALAGAALGWLVKTRH